MSKAFINDSNTYLNVHEFPVIEEPRSVKTLLLQNFDKKLTVLDQSLSTTSHVSDRNLLSDDLSTRSPENEEDSFLYEITSRSPAKPVPRTEESIPALVTDLKASHEIALPGDKNECQKLREPPPHLVYTSKIDSLDKHNCILPISPCSKSPTKNDTYDPVKETAQQGLCNSLQVKKTEKSQTSRVSSTKSPGQSLKSLKRPVCKSKSSVTICSPIRSHSTHPSHILPTKVDSETLGVNSHRKVVTKSRTTPNTSMSVDVFTRLSKRTPQYHSSSSSSSSSSKTNNSTLHISKEAQLRSSASSVARDGNSSLNNSKASKEGLFGTPHRQSAVWSDEAKPLTLQKPKINSNFVKSPSKKIPSRNIPAPHHQIKILKQHHKTKPLEDIKQNSLPRVNPPQDIKTDSETKINTVLLVRTEAAKRGRQAIQEWAEKQMAKS